MRFSLAKSYSSFWSMVTLKNWTASCLDTNREQHIPTNHLTESACRDWGFFGEGMMKMCKITQPCSSVNIRKPLNCALQMHELSTLWIISQFGKVANPKWMYVRKRNVCVCVWTVRLKEDVCTANQDSRHKSQWKYNLRAHKKRSSESDK